MSIEFYSHALAWTLAHLAHLFAFLFMSSEGLGLQKKFRAKGVFVFIFLVFALGFLKLKKWFIDRKIERQEKL